MFLVQTWSACMSSKDSLTSPPEICTSLIALPEREATSSTYSHNPPELTSPVVASQVVQLLLLWAVFLTFQMVKSKYGICTKEYLVLFLAQTVFCISVTTFFMRRELADLGKPAAQQHRDPEMQQLLLGQRGASPDSEALLSFCSSL